MKHSFAPEWDYEQTKKLILSIPEQAIRDYAVFAYVLGGRLNEVRHIMPKDINYTTTKQGEPRIIVRIPTLKNPKIEYRHVPINPETEKEYVEVIMEWKKYFEENNQPLYKPFFFGTNERMIQRKLRLYLDIHPHALRHLRVHHIDDKTIPGFKGLTPRQFKDYFGWSRISTSAYYQSRTTASDLAEQM